MIAGGTDRARREEMPGSKVTSAPRAPVPARANTGGTRPRLQHAPCTNWHVGGQMIAGGTALVGSIRGKAHRLPRKHIWRRSANQWGDGTLHMGSIRRKAHKLPQNAHSKSQHSSGAMEDSVWARAEGEHTKIAVLEYTLVLVSVAVP